MNLTVGFFWGGTGFAHWPEENWGFTGRKVANEFGPVAFDATAFD